MKKKQDSKVSKKIDPVDYVGILQKIRSGELNSINPIGYQMGNEAQHPPSIPKDLELLKNYMTKDEFDTHTVASPTEFERHIIPGACTLNEYWKRSANDQEAWSLYQHTLRVSEVKQRPADFLSLAGPGAFESIAWLGKWAHCGFQSIELDEVYAASMCATTIAPSAISDFHLPWPCFFIRAPKFLQNVLLHGEPILGISVCQFDRCLNPHEWILVSLCTLNRFRLDILKSPLEFCMDVQAHSSTDIVTLKPQPLSTTSLRTQTIVRRFILGACLSMNDRALVRTYSATPGMRKAPFFGERRGTPPAVTLYKIGKPVVVDARLAIRHYLEGSGSKITVRTLVAGHWKKQPYGPQSSLRKWIHIECYWKGPEEAPVVIRPHIVGKTQDSV